MRIAFTIDGNPIAQPRPKFAVRGGFARAYTPENGVKGYKEAIRILATNAKFKAVGWDMGDPMRLELHFFFARPKSHLRTNGETNLAAPVLHAQKPDLDNLEKAVMDALTGAAWHDDAQVVSKEARKYWTKQRAHTQVVVIMTSRSTPQPSATSDQP